MEPSLTYHDDNIDSYSWNLNGNGGLTITLENPFAQTRQPSEYVSKVAKTPTVSIPGQHFTELHPSRNKRGFQEIIAENEVDLEHSQTLNCRYNLVSEDRNGSSVCAECYKIDFKRIWNCIDKINDRKSICVTQLNRRLHFKE
jgi:hypothetical protein